MSGEGLDLSAVLGKLTENPEMMRNLMIAAMIYCNS